MANEPKVFVDANIFLDFLRQRQDWQARYEVTERVRLKKAEGFLSELTVAIIWFQLAKNYPSKTAREKLRKAIHGFKVTTLEPEQVDTAIDDAKFDDIEDALQYYTAKAVAKIFITRNKSDFAKVKGMEVLTPEEFLGKYGEQD